MNIKDWFKPAVQPKTSSDIVQQKKQELHESNGKLHNIELELKLLQKRKSHGSS